MKEVSAESSSQNILPLRQRMLCKPATYAFQHTVDIIADILSE